MKTVIMEVADVENSQEGCMETDVQNEAETSDKFELPTQQGAKPKVNSNVTHLESVNTGEIMLLASGDEALKEESLKKWKAAGIALRKALARVETQTSTPPRDDNQSPVQEGMKDNSITCSLKPSASHDGYESYLGDASATNGMNALLESTNEPLCNFSSLHGIGDTASSQRISQPLYKRTSTGNYPSSVPLEGEQSSLEGNQDKLNIMQNARELQSSEVHDKDGLLLNNSMDTTHDNCIRKKPSVAESLAQNIHINKLSSHPAHGTPRVPCSKHMKHKNRHRSKLPIPVKKLTPVKCGKSSNNKDNVHRVARRTAEQKVVIKKSSSDTVIKPNTVICKWKTKTPDKHNMSTGSPPEIVSSSSSEESSKKSGQPPKDACSFLAAADSVANLADGECSSSLSDGDLSAEEVKVMLEASLLLGDRRPENPLRLLSGSDGSLPSLLSSSDDPVLDEAEEVLLGVRLRTTSAAEGGSRAAEGGDRASTGSSTPPQRQISMEARAEQDQNRDSTDLESDDEFLFGDLPELLSDESQAHEEEPEPIHLSQTELDNALSDLRLESSLEAGDQDAEEDGEDTSCGGAAGVPADDDADDEFECECPTCQYYNGLPDLMPRMNTGGGWGGGSDRSNDEEDDDQDSNFFGSVTTGYHEPFRFSPEELSPLGMLLLQQGRTGILELMFQNVILQMLAVYPDLLGEQAPPPLSPRLFEDLPIIQISTQQTADDSACPICLCVFILQEDAKELPCNHVFHTLCIQAWLSKSGTCPVCRHQLQPKEGNTETVP